MDAQRLLSIGECMMELSPAAGGLLRQSFAGDTFNTAWYARRILPKTYSVDYFTTSGSDRLSASLIGFMHEEAIGIRHVTVVPGGRLGLYMIDVDQDGERSFQYWRDQSAARRLADDPSKLRAAIGGAGFIHVSGITLAILPPEGRETLLAELRRAKASGATVSFDPNLRPGLWESRDAMREMWEQAARAATIAFPGHDEERHIFGIETAEAVLARYLDLGVRTVVVKRGSQGALLHAADETITIPAAPADRVVDTTAAGDSFAGAFLAGLMIGETPERSARKAARVAAGVIGHHGALVQVTIPDGNADA